MLTDTHCHLDFPEFSQDQDEVVKRAKNNGIDYIINIGSSLEGSKKSLELSKKYDFIYATVGLHPHEADKFDKKIEAALADLAKQDKVVAIGEIGLDYFAEMSASRRDTSLKDCIRDKNYSKQENQKILFVSLVELAKDLNLPLVIHSRQAQDDTLKILKEAMPLKAVVHCFSGDENFLKECLSLGFYISFTCNITYKTLPLKGIGRSILLDKKAEKLKTLVKLTPLDRLMLETDAPFLPPQEFRGKRNEPSYVKLLAEEISRIKQTTFEEVARVTTQNAKSFFRLK